MRKDELNEKGMGYCRHYKGAKEENEEIFNSTNDINIFWGATN